MSSAGQPPDPRTGRNRRIVLLAVLAAVLVVATVFLVLYLTGREASDEGLASGPAVSALVA